MSFNAKNLAYEANEPSFLRKLKGQYGETSGRLQRPATPPRKPKSSTDDDDEPIYVDEETNEVISKDQYERIINARTAKGKESDHQEDVLARSPRQRNVSEASKSEKGNAKAEPAPSNQNMAEIGGPKKRKQGKLIAQYDGNSPEKDAESAAPVIRRQAKQKQKKIKLSFGDA